MNTEVQEVKVQVIRDPKTMSVLDAARIAVANFEADQAVEKAGNSVAAVLHAEMVRVRAHWMGVFAAAGEEYGEDQRNATALKFEEALAEAEAFMRKELPAGKLPRVWIEAKSHLKSFVELNGDPEECDTMGKCRTWNSKERTRLKEKGAADALQRAAALAQEAAAKGEHVQDTGAGNTNIEKHEQASKSVSVQTGGTVATDGLDDEVADLLRKIAKHAGAIDTARAIKMLSGFEQQLEGVAKKAITKLAANG